MYLIAGLGNPTKKYEGTRHNVGFQVIDKLADKLGVSVNEKKFKGVCARGMAGGEKVLLLKPETFMNLSGESIRAAVDFYRIEPEHLIIIYDDIDLKNIIAHMGTQEFPRVRVGIGAKPDRMDLADYVLGHFPQVEKPVMEDAFEAAAQAALTIIEEGPDVAMNRFNRQKG